ncbi:MAG: DUF554 domain-containing protein [Lawsonibacter sp.]|jgi:uncharacterized membrane protein YqgA involved in biofilm formation
MPGIGTLVNVSAIILGGLLGLLLKGGLKEHYQRAVIRSLGICTMFIGAAGALAGMLSLTGATLTTASTRVSLGMVLSLSLGTFLGEWLDLDGKMERLGAWLKARADRSGGDSQFIEGFVTASLTVCIGAMAIVGSIQDGLSHDPSTLFTKSMLDFLIVMIFASTYGKGAVFSALPVGILQGSVTLFAELLSPVFSQAVIDNLSFLGAILIFCVGLNLAFDSRFRVANMLPALVFGAVYTVFF